MELSSAIIVGLWASFAIYWTISAYQTGSSHKSSASYWSLGIFLLLLLGVFVFLNQFGSWKLMLLGIVPETGISQGIGIILAAAGIGFAIWARSHLGQQWSGMPSIQESHELIRTGPYHYVRHPIYTGVLLALKGSLVVVNQVWMLLLLFLALVAFLLKIRDEENMLEEEFGEKYQEYKKKAKVLIPFIL